MLEWLVYTTISSLRICFLDLRILLFTGFNILQFKSSFSPTIIKSKLSYLYLTVTVFVCYKAIKISFFYLLLVEVEKIKLRILNKPQVPYLGRDINYEQNFKWIANFTISSLCMRQSFWFYVIHRFSNIVQNG